MNLKQMTYERYHDIEATRASELKAVAKSPLHYEHLRKTPMDADYLRLGSAVHTAVLEPELFGGEYVLWTGGVRNSKKWREFEAEHADRVILTEKQMSDALMMATAVRKHAVAGPLLRSGVPEQVAEWVDERTGIECKARVDWLNNCHVSLKTTAETVPYRFNEQSAKLKYNLTEAFNSDGLFAVTGERRPVKIIAVESKAPHDVAVYHVPDEVLNYGREIYEDALDLLIQCRASGEWPGVCPEEETLTLPMWAAAQDPIDWSAVGDLGS